MGQIFHYNHLSFLVESDSRPGEVHIVEFHHVREGSTRDRAETCSCERFTMGIPKLIKEGQLRDTVPNRRCRHLIQVLEALANERVDELKRTDPSQPTRQQRHHDSQIYTSETGHKEIEIER